MRCKRTKFYETAHESVGGLQRDRKAFVAAAAVVGASPSSMSAVISSAEELWSKLSQMSAGLEMAPSACAGGSIAATARWYASIVAAPLTKPVVKMTHLLPVERATSRTADIST